MRHYAHAVALFLAMLSVPTLAAAQSYVSRPMTTSSGQLDIFVGPAPRPLLEDAGFIFASGADDLYLNTGVSFGITDDVELGAYPLRLRLFDDSDIDNPYIYGTFRLVRGATEVGIRPVIPIPVFDGSFWLRLDIPVIVRLGGHARLETGGQLELGFDDPLRVLLTVPLRLVFNIGPRFFLGLDTGVRVPLSPSGSAAIPFGVFVGYTVASGVDIGLAVRWNDLFVSGRDPAFDGGAPSLTLGVNVYSLL